MPGDADPLDRRARAAHEGACQLALRGGEREHRAAVVGIRVEVEQPGRRKAALDGLEHGGVAALADVRD